MTSDPGPPRIWVLADDRAGNRSQALGVSERLGPPVRVQEIRYNARAALPNRLLGASFLGLLAESRQALVPPWPDIVVAAGRRTAPAARAIRRRSGGRTFLVQIMDPGAGRDEFGLIAVPRHDRLAPAANIVTIVGAPHRVTPAALAAAAAEWAPRLAHLPRPWGAVLVGGSTRRRPFTAAMAGDLAAAVSAQARAAGGSLLVSTSRRTGAAADALVSALAAPAHVYRWGDGGDNPYLGYLALADAVVVTGDSVSMCSEACATTAPVTIYAPPGHIGRKHRRLHRALFELGYARPLGNGAATAHPPLDDAAVVAAEVRRRLGF